MLRFIRWFLGKIILSYDATFSPKPMLRDASDQSRIDRETLSMTLYQFEACPFCVKTRRAIKRMNLSIALKDARNDPQAREELLKGGGSVQVPCLRLTESDGSVRWMYESSDIIAYLASRFSAGTSGATRSG